MSEQGIKLAGKIFLHLQLLRLELIKMGERNLPGPSGRQDIRLGQMMNDGKDAMKETFVKITMEPT